MKTLELTKGLVALIDDEDYEWLSRYKWSANRTKTSGPYAVRSVRLDKRTRGFAMHRQVMERYLGISLDKTQLIDHIDFNSLNNQKANLRVVTKAENNRWQQSKPRKNNKSGFIGVRFDKKCKNPWRAEITVNGKNRPLGGFKTPQAAAKAYNSAAIEFHGTLAKRNNLCAF